MTRIPIRTIIETWKACGQNSSEAARQLGIDRRTVKRWVDRGRQPWGYVRWRGVQRQSTVPKHPKRVLSGEGYECGREDGLLSSWRSWQSQRGFGIRHRYLHRVGLVRSTKRRRENGQVMRPSNCPRYLLVKYVRSGLPNVLPVCCLDISTRYKVGLILPKVDEAGSLLALYHATQTLPFPVCYVQTDNGLEFRFSR